ncbi:hypothetical protein KAR91_79515 [Candidatus Pacearchaeota archaeon]|nr:hypothetical protein [Candidatus Pacearchaeota archaeon]
MNYLLPEPWKSWVGLGFFLGIIVIGIWYIWIPLIRYWWEERRRDPNCSGIAERSQPQGLKSLKLRYFREEGVCSNEWKGR